MAFPPSNDVVNAVGTNLRRLRVQRGVSTAELARRSDVARATLTALEAGRGNPTLETLYALARVLDVSLAELITDPRTPASVVLRADEGVWVNGSSVDARLLDRLDRHLRTDLYDIVIRAGSPQLSAAHQAGVTESFLCHDGLVRIGPATSRSSSALATSRASARTSRTRTKPSEVTHEVC